MRSAPRHRSFSLLALAAAGTLLLGSCGLLEDEAAGGSTKTSGDTRAATVAELEQLLPTAAEINELAEVDDHSEGYVVDTSGDEEEAEDPSESDAVGEAKLLAAVEANCPAMLEQDLFDLEHDATARVTRTFRTGERGKTVEVDLDAEPKRTSSEDLDALVQATMACDPFDLDVGDGLSMNLDFGMARDDAYGDRGVTMTFNMVMSHPDLPSKLHLMTRARFMVVGSVGVVVSAGDGYEDADDTDEPPAETRWTSVMDADYHLVDELSQIVGAEVAALVG